MARHENITLPKINMNLTPEELEKETEEMKKHELTEEEEDQFDKELIDDILHNRIAVYIDEYGRPYVLR